MRLPHEFIGQSHKTGAYNGYNLWVYPLCSCTTYASAELGAKNDLAGLFCSWRTEQQRQLDLHSLIKLAGIQAK